MKQSMKRIISLALSLVLLICLLPAAAFAAGGTLTSAAVQVSHPIAGQYPVPVGYPAESARYEVSNFEYYPVNSNGGTTYPLGWETPFELGTVYRIYIILKSINGWTFSEDTKVTINGREAILQSLRSSTEGVYYVDIKATSSIFSDVNAGDWFAEAVQYCFERNLMVGTGDGSVFSPNIPFTRGMFVTVLARIDEADTSAYTGSSFTDVKTGKWYAPSVEWAYQKGYASGVGNSQFAPETGVTREMLAMFLYKYTAKKYGQQSLASGANLSSYADNAKISSWAKDAMDWAVKTGLIGGVKQNGKTYLMPGRIASRAVVAQIVMKYIKNVVSKM